MNEALEANYSLNFHSVHFEMASLKLRFASFCDFDHLNEVEIKSNNKEQQDTEKSPASTAAEMDATVPRSEATTDTTTTTASAAATSTEISSSLSNMVTQDVTFSQQLSAMPNPAG